MSHAQMLRHLFLTMQQEWLTAVMETQHSLDFLHKNRDCRWAFGAAIKAMLGMYASHIRAAASNPGSSTSQPVSY